MLTDPSNGSPQGTATLTNVTVAANTAQSGTGGGLASDGTITMKNTIVAGNNGGNCSGDDGSLVSQGYNLENTDTCFLNQTGDLPDTEPQLDDLDDNGGGTETHALPEGSPAVNTAGDCPPPNVDQRGVDRPYGTACDIGAYEFVPPPLEPPPPPPPPPEDDTPVLGKTVNVEPIDGDVFFRLPGGSARASQKGRAFFPLTEERLIPVRSILDTTRGTVALKSARNRKGKLQSGRFSDGLFQVLQSRKLSARGLTTLRLKGSAAKFKRCGRGKGSSSPPAKASLSRRAIRRLKSRAKGRYRTRGKHSAATVRGTRWNMKDSCAGTLTKVKRGKVRVRDFRRKKTIVLTRGKRYLARAR
jgi:hypothetical protein